MSFEKFRPLWFFVILVCDCPNNQAQSLGEYTKFMSDSAVDKVRCLTVFRERYGGQMEVPR